MPIVCEDANSSITCATTAGTKQRTAEAGRTETEKAEAGDAVTQDAAKTSVHSVELDPSYQPPTTQETTRTDDTASMSFHCWERQQSTHSRQSGQARVDRLDNMGGGNVPLACGSLGLSDDSGEVGGKGDSAAFAAANHSIMSSIESSVQWQDNATASTMWHENPLNVLAGTGDSIMSDHAAHLASDQQKASGQQPTAGATSSLMKVVVNPLAVGASNAADAESVQASL